MIVPFFAMSQTGINLGDVKPIKKSDFLKNDKAIVQTLDSTVAWVYDGGAWEYSWKSLIVARHWLTGLPYEWNRFDFSTTENKWLKRNQELITYNSDDQADVEKYLVYPYNSFTNSWAPDTVFFTHTSGYYSKQLQQEVYTGDYISQNYLYLTNAVAGGSKYRIYNYQDSLYDYYFYYNRNTTTESWDLLGKTDFSYDQNNVLYNMRSYQWDNVNKEFVNSGQTFYQYENYNPIQIVSQSWNGSMWVNNDRDEYEYDANSNRTLAIDYEWNSVTNAWEYYSKYTYTYVNNKVMEKVYQRWNSGTASWDNDYRYIYAYDSNGNIITEREDEWSGGVWEFYERNTYTYDGTLLTQRLYEYWDAVGSTWINGNKNVYTYNSAGFETSYLYQTYNSGTSSWVNSQRNISDYDANNNRIYYDFAYWDNVGGTWVYDYKNNYYWSQYDANAVSELENKMVDIFPNPRDRKSVV